MNEVKPHSVVNCNNLMLIDFEQCLLYDNYTSLNGNSEQETASIWERVYAEYLTLIGDNTIVSRVYQIATLNKFTLKINRVTMLLWFMELGYNTTIADMLREEFKNVPLTPDNYKADCKRINNLMMQDRMYRDRARKAIENASNEAQSTEIDKAYFDSALIAFGSVMGFHKSKREISTQEYCIMMRELNRAISQKQKQTQ